MNSEAESTPLSRIVKVDEIKDAASGEIVATADEMNAIAGLLDLARLEGLTFTYRLDHGIAGRLHLSGRLKAELTQTCVVSLDPVDARVDEPVEIEFWPETLLAKPESDDPAGLTALDWPEPIVGGRIDLGVVAYETLATSLDPYPKREQGEAKQPERAKSGPFAALAALKRDESST